MSKTATETAVLRYLADAIDHIEEAKVSTENGLVAGHCENALIELLKALKKAIGET